MKALERLTLWVTILGLSIVPGQMAYQSSNSQLSKDLSSFLIAGGFVAGIFAAAYVDGGMQKANK